MLLYMQCRIQQFFGGAGFSMFVSRRETAVQLRSLGGSLDPPWWGSGAKPRKILVILHSE